MSVCTYIMGGRGEVDEAGWEDEKADCADFIYIEASISLSSQV